MEISLPKKKLQENIHCWWENGGKITEKYYSTLAVTAVLLRCHAVINCHIYRCPYSYLRKLAKNSHAKSTPDLASYPSSINARAVNSALHQTFARASIFTHF